MPGRLAPWRSFRGKLYAVFGTVVVLGAFLGVFAYVQLADVQRLSDDVVDTSTAHSLVQEVAVALADLESDLDDFLIVHDGISRSAVDADVERIEATVAVLHHSEFSEVAVAEELDEASVETESLVAMVTVLVASSNVEAGVHNRLVADAFGQIDRVRAMYNDFNETSLGRVNAAVASQTAILEGLSLRLLVLGALIVAILLAASFYVDKSVRSIGKVTDTALAIAGGDLDREVPTLGRDEIGLLAGAFNSMTQQLSDLIGTLEQRVQRRTEELSSVNESLQEEVAERRTAEESLRGYAERLEAALQELGEAQAQLLQSQKLEAIGSLAAGVAHEINTPIQYVSDNALFLQDSFNDVLDLVKKIDAVVTPRATQLDDEGSSEYNDAIERADIEYLADEVPSAIEETIDGVNRIAEIVRALKEFSHPGGQDKAPVDLNRLISNTISVSKNEWKYVADVETDFAEAMEPVQARSGPLGQAILILIVNAAQAIAETIPEGSDQRGTITVTTSADDAAAVITVADTGCGIPEEIREKVFEHFFTTKDVGKGSGQGLAIAHAIVTEQHGGELAFTSEVGTGTTFSVRIPHEQVDSAG